MKTIIIYLFAILFFGIIATGFSKIENEKGSILILTAEEPVSANELSKAAEIIEARLVDFLSEKFSVALLPEKNQIRVSIAVNMHTKLLESLLTQKGAIGFYETYNRMNLSELLKGDDRLFSLFGESNEGNKGARIGCTTNTEIGKVNEYIGTLELDQKCKFAWSQTIDNPEVCLYALRTHAEKGALLTDSDVESMKFKLDKVSNSNTIDIQFKKPASTAWSEITRRNMNEAIAIVLDDEVISAPVVKSVIENGRSSISGAFSQEQARFIAALGDNGELPVKFKVVK